MSRTLLTLTFTLMLTTIGLLGMAPTVAAEECVGASCIENCYVGAGGRVTAQCDVGHQPTGIDGCFSFAPDCSWVVHCSALDGSSASCTTYPPEDQVCTGGNFLEVCADVIGDGCMVWTDGHFGKNCRVGRIIN